MEVLTLFMAESVRREATGKLTVVGMMFNAKLPGGPSDNVGEICVFATVTGLPKGPHKATVRIDAAHNELTFEPDGTDFDSGGENNILKLVLRIPDFSFPASGKYTYTLVIDGRDTTSNLVAIDYEIENTPDVGKETAAREATDD